MPTLLQSFLTNIEQFSRPSASISFPEIPGENDIVRLEKLLSKQNPDGTCDVYANRRIDTDTDVCGTDTSCHGTRRNIFLGRFPGEMQTAITKLDNKKPVYLKTHGMFPWLVDYGFQILDFVIAKTGIEPLPQQPSMTYATVYLDDKRREQNYAALPVREISKTFIRENGVATHLLEVGDREDFHMDGFCLRWNGETTIMRVTGGDKEQSLLVGKGTLLFATKDNDYYYKGAILPYYTGAFMIESGNLYPADKKASNRDLHKPEAIPSITEISEGKVAVLPVRTTELTAAQCNA